jgi:hypothetical protein
MQHILITKAERTAAFTRNDCYYGRWVQHGLSGQPLRAVIASIVADVEVTKGNTGVTLSSCRGWDAFLDPDNACIPAGVNVMALCPIELTPEGDRDLTLWTVLYWNGPDSDPARGEKVPQRLLGEWFEKTFTDEQYAIWNKPHGVLNLEIWLRPTWSAKEMFPNLFGVVKPQAGTQPVEKTRAAKIKYIPKTKWKVTDENGIEVKSGINSKQEAESVAHRYELGEPV